MQNDPAVIPIPCPSPETLVKLLRDDLAGAEAGSVEAHVDSCPACQQLLQCLIGGLPGTIAESSAGLPSGDKPPPVPGHEILGVLGEGGMGVVYKAIQTAVGRVVALKMIRSGAGSASERARFRAEAEAAAKLTHPGIVRVYEFGECAGAPYFTLEFCDAGSLAARLDGTPWHPIAAARLVEMLADAVAAAHKQGIVHRDLKPANVLLTRAGGPDGGTVTDPGTGPLLYAALRTPHGAVPKVTDFGISKRLGSPDGPTATGTVMGTPSYMAPEQASGDSKRVGPPADVYALGAVLYELLTGRPPFRAQGVMETLDLVRNQEPVTVRALNPNCPRDLETICLKCLQKQPEKRYAAAAELADDLRRFQEGRAITARPVGRTEQLAKWVKRNKGLSAALAAAALILVAGSVVSTVFGLESAHQAGVAKKHADIADTKTEDAKRARTEAETDRDIAKKERDIANERKEQLRGMVYAARFDELQVAKRENRFERVREILRETMPEPGESDLRGWEWCYYDRWLHPELISFALPDAEGYRRAVRSPRSLQSGEASIADYDGAMALSDDGRELILERVVPDGRVFDLWDIIAGKRVATYPPKPIAIPDPESQVPKQPRPVGSPPVEYQQPPVLSADWRFVAVRVRMDAKRVVRVLNLRTGEQVAEFEIELAPGDDILTLGPNADWLVGLLRMPYDREAKMRPSPELFRWSRATGKVTRWKMNEPPLKREGQAEYTRGKVTGRVGADATRFVVATVYTQLAGDEPPIDNKHIERFEHCEDEWDLSVDPPRLVRTTRVPVSVPFNLTKVRRDHEAFVSRNHQWVASIADGKIQVTSAADQKPAWERRVDFKDSLQFGDRWHAHVADDGSKVALLGPEHVFLVFHRPDTSDEPGLQAVYPTQALRPYSARFSADGKRLVHVSLYPEARVAAWDISRPPEFETLQPLADIRARAVPRKFVVQDGRVEIEMPYQYSAKPPNTEVIVLRDTRTGQEIARLPGHSANMKLTADGTRLLRDLSTSWPYKPKPWELYDTATGKKVGEGTLELTQGQSGWIRPCGNWLCEHVVTVARKTDPKTGMLSFELEPRAEPVPPAVLKKEPRAQQLRVQRTETRFRDLASGALIQLHDDAKQLPIHLRDGESTSTDDLIARYQILNVHHWKPGQPILVWTESDHPTPKYSRPDPENPADRPQHRRHGLKAFDPKTGKLLWANPDMFRSPMDHALLFHWQPVSRLVGSTFTPEAQVLSPDANWLVVSGFPNWASPVAAVIVRPADGSGAKTIVLPHPKDAPTRRGTMLEGMSRFAFSKDSKRVCMWGAGPLGVAEVESGNVLWHTSKFDGAVLEANFSADGRRLFTTEAARGVPAKLRVWDVATGRNLVSLPIPPSDGADAVSRIETTLFRARFTVDGDVIRLPTGRGVRIFDGTPRGG